MATHSSVLAWRFRGQRSLVGYSPWGPKELDTTEHGLRGAAYVPYIYIGFPGHKILGLHLIFLNVLNILPFFFCRKVSNSDDKFLFFLSHSFYFNVQRILSFVFLLSPVILPEYVFMLCILGLYYQVCICAVFIGNFNLKAS